VETQATRDLPHTPIWERQPGESRMWYSRLEAYLRLGPARSLLGAYKADRAAREGLLGLDPPPARSGREIKAAPCSWRLAAARNGWRERAEAWDDHQAELDRAEWRERRRRIREVEWQTSETLLKRAQELAVDLETTWRGGDVARAAQVGSELGRRATGLDRQDASADEGAPGRIEIEGAGFRPPEAGEGDLDAAEGEGDAFRD
jgi:hypothetical protein